MNAFQKKQFEIFTERFNEIKTGPEFMQARRLAMFVYGMESVFYIGNRLDKVDPQITALYAEAKSLEEGVGV